MLVVATLATSNWETLESTPVSLEAGEHITYGYGTNKIWGVFPVDNDDATYIATYDLSSHNWSEEEEFAFYMSQTSITFQWLEGGVLYVIGNEDGPVMYTYNVTEDEWESPDVDFSLNDGACIAYQPNGNYDIQVNPIPGWIYCLPGGSKDFWRYAIPSSYEPVPLNGIYPGQGAQIADLTPLFQWGSGSGQNRLVVSTDSNLIDTVIDEVVSAESYQVTSELANGTYYWRTGIPNSGGWTWSPRHDFELDGGWEYLDELSIPQPVGLGAALSFIDDGQGHDSLIAFPGNSGSYFYEYDISPAGWFYKTSTYPRTQGAGTSLVAGSPTGTYPWAVFGGQGTDDYPYYYDPTEEFPLWYADDGDPANKYPEDIASNASATLAPPCHLYLAVGNNHFYRIDPPILEGGMSARRSRPATPQAHVVTRKDVVEVEYQLPVSGQVRATLHDAVGRQIAVTDAGLQAPGSHRMSWNQDCEGRRLAAGTYFVLLDIGAEQARLKAVVR